MKKMFLTCILAVALLGGCQTAAHRCKVQENPDYNTESLDRAIMEEADFNWTGQDPRIVTIALAMSVMDPGYCQHDPGHHPDYYDWLDKKYEDVPCPGGGFASPTCQALFDATYNDYLNFFDDEFRQAVCSCWTMYPSNSASDVLNRILCIATVANGFTTLMNDYYDNEYKPDVIDLCCVPD